MYCINFFVVVCLFVVLQDIVFIFISFFIFYRITVRYNYKAFWNSNMKARSLETTNWNPSRFCFSGPWFSSCCFAHEQIDCIRPREYFPWLLRLLVYLTMPQAFIVQRTVGMLKQINQHVL